MNGKAVEALPEDQRKTVTAVQDDYKKLTFARTAMLPAFMLACYIGLWLHFRSRGGYKPMEIGGGAH